MKRNYDKDKVVAEIHQWMIRYPRSTNRRPVRLFQEILTKYPEKLSYPVYLNLYSDCKINDDEFSQRVADYIISNQRVQKERSIGFAGKGGKRGPGKEWRIYMEATITIYTPEEPLRLFGINPTPDNVAILIKGIKEIVNTRDLSRINGVSKASKWAASSIVIVLDEFFKKFDESNQRHRRALELIFQDNSELYFPKLTPCIGKKVTKESIMKSVNTIHGHILNKSCAKSLNQDFYRRHKLYYLMWLANEIMQWLDIHSRTRVRMVARKIVGLITRVL